MFIRSNYFAFIAIAAIIFGGFACGDSPEKIANDQFNKAVELYNQKYFNESKLVLDEIINTYTKQDGPFTKAKALLNTISIEEQQQNIVFLDSILTIKQAELTVLMKNFEKEVTEGLPTMLIHKHQKTNNSYNRCFIKAHLDTVGNYYISSQYCGQGFIEHNQIKVSTSDQSAMSEQIEFDEFYNRRFNDVVNYWEVIQFKEGKDNGVIDFIALNHEKTIKLQFSGKKSHTVFIEKHDKEAIRDSYEISFLLKEISKLNNDMANAHKTINKLKNKSNPTIN